MVATTGQSRKQRQAAELARITERSADGLLLPQTVVDVAADPDNVLHDQFEWDDSVAGAKYRLTQAEDLIRSVRIEIEELHVSVRAVAYISDPEGQQNKPGYRSIDEVAEKPSAAQAAIEVEIERVRAMVRRAREIALALGRLDELNQRLADLV